MMGREKEIEEIAKIIARRSAAFRNPNVAFMTTARKTADSIYSAGYRKQREVAEEIFYEIEKLVSTNKKTVGCATYEETIFYIEDFIEDLAELKKKYTGEKEETGHAKQPTADVVEVVRCKDCAVPHNQWTGCPKLNGLVTSPDFYCNYGERRRER